MPQALDCAAIRGEEASIQPEFDFIRDYTAYADVIEAPPIMHEVVATQLIAAILNKNGVHIRLGGLSAPLDLWTVLLSGSGGGRSTLVTFARPILVSAGLADMERSSHWASPQAMYQDLAEHPTGLFVWGELAEKLKMLSDNRFRGAKEWLTDRYDNLRVADTITYRSTGLIDRDTPQIRFAAAPRITILATSSEDWFFNNLMPEDTTGGFVPRWLLVRAPNVDRVVPIPRSPDENLVPPLSTHLRSAAELRGDADLSCIAPSYESWYRAARLRFMTQPNPRLAMAFFHRHRIQILKLAVIYEVSMSLSLSVSQNAWDRAVEFAARMEETIFSLLDTGMSGAGYKRKQMEEKIQSAAEEGMTLSEFTRAFQHTEKDQRDKWLDTLVIGEQLYGFTRFTAGRPSKFLVHRDFVEAYRAQHPNDSPIQVRHRG
jgi:hypothetical protein